MKIQVLFLIIVGTCLPQTTIKEDILNLDSSIVHVSAEGENIYKLKYFDGQTTYRNLNTYSNNKTEKNYIPTTEFYIWELDTNLYKDKYYYWQEMPLSTTANYQLCIDDFNDNKLPEIYGYKKDDNYPFITPVQVYEMDSNYMFIYKGIYPDSIFISKGIFNLEGEKRIFLNSLNGNGHIYKSLEPTQLPFQLDFSYNVFTSQDPGQINSPAFSDFDKDNKTDMVYYDETGRRVVICEYDSITNGFIEVSEIPYKIGVYDGFVTGDFDLNGKTEIAYGGIWGEAVVLEADAEHSYKLKWQDTVETYNAYMQLFTNDIDENGKPELWVIGFAFYNDYPRVRLTCFESDGVGGYKEKNRVDIVGVFPFFASNEISIDVNKDGKDEMVFCMDNYIFMIEYKDGKYQMFYMHLDTFENNDGVTMYDLDNDKFEEMLIHGLKPNQNGEVRSFTKILKPSFVVNVAPEENINSAIKGYKLFQNYPNPFNSSTTIEFTLLKNTNVDIRVFDILGQEISELFAGYLVSGNHKIQWNGKNNLQQDLKSGVYFIRVKSEEYTSSIKIILLK